MTVKFAYTTDWHICFKQPTTRKDDVLTKQLDKLIQFVNICNAANLDFIIHGGDIFDAPRYSDPSIVNSVIDILKLLKCPMYSIPGSHDMYGYNLNTLTQAYAGTLRSSGCITLLAERGIYKFPGELQIGVIPAYLDPQIDTYNKFIGVDIIVTHDMLVNTDTSVLPYKCISINELAQKFSKTIFLCGHNHTAFYKAINNNLFINPGPLVRTASNEADHVPHIFIITKNNNNIINEKHFITADTDVFYTADTKTDTAVNTFQFLDTLRNTNIEFCDVYDLLTQVQKQLQIADIHVAHLKERFIHAEQNTR